VCREIFKVTAPQRDAAPPRPAPRLVKPPASPRPPSPPRPVSSKGVVPTPKVAPPARKPAPPRVTTPPRTPSRRPEPPEPPAEEEALEVEIVDEEEVDSAVPAAAAQPSNLAKKKFKPRSSSAAAQGQTLLLSLSIADAAGSILVGLLILFGVQLGLIIEGPILSILLKLGLIDFRFEFGADPAARISGFHMTVAILLFVRAAATGVLAVLQYYGQEVARLVWGWLLIAGAALGGIAILLGLIDLVRLGFKFFSGTAILYLLVQMVWLAGHGVLGGYILQSSMLQAFVQSRQRSA
jgi:hypothetical protein